MAPDPLPHGEEKARAVRRMFDGIAPRYDLLNRVLTFGLDVRWRRKAVAALGLPPGSLVLDLACGTGDLCRELARAGHRAVGLDFAFEMLAVARRRRDPGPGRRLGLVQADVLRLPVRDGVADGATCGFALRNVTDMEDLFRETARAVRPGGRVAVLEVSRPPHPLVRTGHALYFRRIVPVVGGLLSDPEAYRYLPRSMEYLPEPHELAAMMRRTGFSDARSRPLSGGVAQLLVGTRR